MLRDAIVLPEDFEELDEKGLSLEKRIQKHEASAQNANFRAAMLEREAKALRRKALREGNKARALRREKESYSG